MKFELLTDEMQASINQLKYGSSTIECDVKDEIEKADSFTEAQDGIKNAMIRLISECMDVIEFVVADKDYALKFAIRWITGDRVDEVVENNGQVWYKSLGQWKFIMIEFCEKANTDEVKNV